MPPGNFRFYNMIIVCLTLKTAGTSSSSENGKSVFCLLTRLYNINRDQTSHVGNMLKWREKKERIEQTLSEKKWD